MSKSFSTRKRIRRKRNFLIHLMIYLSFGAFFFLLNLFTGMHGDMWFVFPMLPLGLVLAFHFIFSIGRDYVELVAARWEAREQGRSLEEYIDFIEDEMELVEDLDRFELRKEVYRTRINRSYDKDFV